MSYRTDESLHCFSCRARVSDGEGLFTKDGELACRGCSSRLAIQETTRELARSGSLTRREKSPAELHFDRKLSAWLLAPIAVFTTLCVLQLVGEVMSTQHCSEMGCIGLVFIPMAGIVVGMPLAILATVKAPVETRNRVALLAFGGIALMFGACLVPLHS